jgi:hypothetical protein
VLTKITPDEPQRLYQVIFDRIPAKMQLLRDLLVIQPPVPAKLEDQPPLRG